MSGGGCLVSGLVKATAATAGPTTAASDQRRAPAPSTTPWDTAKTTKVTAPVISGAPRHPAGSVFRRSGTDRVAEDGRGHGGPDQADGHVTRNTTRQLVSSARDAAEDLAGHEAALETAP